MTLSNLSAMMSTSRFILTGLQAQELLEACHKNSIPGIKEKPAYTSGLRLGTPAMTARRFREEDFALLGHLISKILKNPDDENIKKEAMEKVHILASTHPLPYEW